MAVESGEKVWDATWESSEELHRQEAMTSRDAWLKRWCVRQSESRLKGHWTGSVRKESARGFQAQRAVLDPKDVSRRPAAPGKSTGNCKKKAERNAPLDAFLSNF